MGSGTRDESSSGYWYDRQADLATSVLVLNAMRAYRAAEAGMRKRTRDAMGMGETDLLAIRFLLQAERSGTAMSPKDLSARLGISSASTTILIDRLERGGHVRRQPHPHDRRAIIVSPTMATDGEVRKTLSAMHERMIEVAGDLSDSDAATVVGFLQRMRDAVDSVDPAE